MNKFIWDKDVWSKFKRDDKGDVTELRAFEVYGNGKHHEGYAKGVISGYFSDPLRFEKKARDLDKDGLTVYMTLQVINPALLARANGRMKATNKTTSDNDVLYYRWLPIDLDPIRPSGISSSDGELNEALKLQEQISKYCIDTLGLAKPIKAMSGNGAHLLFPLKDIPANMENRNKIKKSLESLKRQFPSDTVDLDVSVHNPSRIWKIYGTHARKGDNLSAAPNRIARPHRQSYIFDLGE